MSAKKASSSASRRSHGRTPKTQGRSRARRATPARRGGSAPSTRGRSDRTIRYAVVGLGYIAQVAVLPAFANARRNSRLTALVSDDPVKLKQLGRRYGVAHTYSYDQYEECLASGEIDAVYIALPNHLHREYTVRAARAGIHVLCEKPMAVTVEECEEMIRAAEEHDVRLMIAYRLHFEESNLKAVEIARSRLGDVRYFNSVFSMQVKAGDIRLQKRTGGGTLYDIGIYCLNAARYLFKAEPLEVFAFSANNGEERFREVDEMTGAVLAFPEARLATFISSFGATDRADYEIVGTKGSLRVENAFEYAMERKHILRIGERTTERRFAKRDQFAPELLHFSDCVIQGKEPEPSGLEGRIDVEIVESLYRSAEIGKPVAYRGPERRRRPTSAQEIDRPAVSKPELVHASSPSKDS